MIESPVVPVQTDRLLFHGWTKPHHDAYLRMLNDLEVTRFLPISGPVTSQQIHASFERGAAHWARYGYGVWLLSDLSTGALVGHCGLRYLEEFADTEVLYAIARPFWGRGLATEAAAAAVSFGFERAGLDRIIALAVPENAASIGVMRKIGMTFEGEADSFGLHLVKYAIDRT